MTSKGQRRVKILFPLGIIRCNLSIPPKSHRRRKSGRETDRDRQRDGETDRHTQTDKKRQRRVVGMEGEVKWMSGICAIGGRVDLISHCLKPQQQVSLHTGSAVGVQVKFHDCTLPPLLL